MQLERFGGFNTWYILTISNFLFLSFLKLMPNWLSPTTVPPNLPLSRPLVTSMLLDPRADPQSSYQLDISKLGQRRNQKGNLKISWNKRKWKHNISKPMGCCKGSSKRSLSDKCHIKKKERTQTNLLTTQGTRKRTN